MRIWTPFPFIRFTASFILGILAQLLVKSHFQTALTFFLIFIAVYIVLFYLARNKIFTFYSSYLGLLALLILFLAGYLRAYQFTETNDPQHITYFQEKLDQITYYEAEVAGLPEEDDQGISTEIAVRKVKVGKKWEKASGKVNFYIRKDHDKVPLAYGDLVLIKGFCQPVKKTMNPAAFDYKAYLANQNIYFTDYISSQDFLLLGKKDNFSIIGYALKAQSACAKIIKKYVDDPSAQSIVLALTLGMKSDLEKSLQQAYATAGVMHVLAVSGLHVGIIYSVLLFVFGWLKKLGFNWAFAFVCLALLWSFAFITGLSPSVLRAVTMFSFFIVAKASNRHTNSYNTLAASAFFLLFLNPLFILSVGFQLSYLAVLGILFLFPKLYKLIDPPNSAVDGVWKLCCVSLAAQLAVFPISTYYFHQFPLYFLLANLVLVPTAFLMLSLALGVLALSFYPPLAAFVGSILSFLVSQINRFVYAISHLPLSNISGLYISGMQAFLLMAIILLICVFFHYKKFLWLVVITGLCCCFQLIHLKHQWDKVQRKQITYYSISRSGLLGFSEGDFAQLVPTGGRKLSKASFNYSVKPNLIRMDYPAPYPFEKLPTEAYDKALQVSEFEHGKMVIWNGYKLLIVDKPFAKRFNFKEQIEVDILIVEQDAIKSLDELPENLAFEQLMIGNSCKYYIAHQLIEEAKSVNLAFVHPLTTGAWIVNLNR